jgi:hypothetical protein
VTHLHQAKTGDILSHFARRWGLESCQTQPIKITWCPLRLFGWAINSLRGGFKREDKMDVHVFSRDDDFFDQALSYGLALFKREPFEVIAQQLAKGLGVLDDLLPMNGLLPSAG